MEKVVKDDVTGCWNFMGHLQNGYGTIKVGGKFGSPHQVHREMYKIYKSDIPKGLFVCHKCDNPKCCNPEHLFLGTHKDNMKDMVEKGRRNNPYGEKAYYHKLTNKEVEDIRKDTRIILLIAKDYNTTKSNVSMIKNFKTRMNG